MRKTDIERIIKQGTVKQQIKLYMTDTALFNLSYSRDNALLTDKERYLIWNNIKTDKDIKYYEELRIWNKMFTVYKPHVDNFFSRLRANFNVLQSTIIKIMTIKDFIEMINPTLYSIKDLKLRAEILNTLLKNSKYVGGIKDKEGEGIKDTWFNVDYKEEREMIEDFVKRFNSDVHNCKNTLLLLSTLVNKQLPLKPYKDWVKKEEKKVKDLIKAIPDTIVGIDINITPYEEAPVISKEEINSNINSLKDD